MLRKVTLEDTLNNLKEFQEDLKGYGIRNKFSISPFFFDDVQSDAHRMKVSSLRNVRDSLMEFRFHMLGKTDNSWYDYGTVDIPISMFNRLKSIIDDLDIHRDNIIRDYVRSQCSEYKDFS